MRVYVKILSLLILFYFTLAAQTKTDNGSSLSVNKETIIEDTDLRFFSFSSISERHLTTAVILGELIILFCVLYYWKKTRNDKKTSLKSVFKKNIRAIRDERVKPHLDSEKTRKRHYIKDKIKLNNLTSKNITSEARKRLISKGELFLAVRINQLQNLSK